MPPRMNWDSVKQRKSAHRIGYEGSTSSSALQRAIAIHRACLIDVIEKAKQQPCSACGQRFPSCVMQFHHRDPEQKLFPISEATALLPGIDVLEEELAKCDVLCANCHAIKTSEQWALGQVRNRHKRL